MQNLIRCGTCNKVLLPEDEGKTWANFIKNSPPDCFDCAGSTFAKLEKHTKTINKNNPF